MTFDPYKAPESELERDTSNRSTELRITENMIAALTQTRPWVIFLAILGFIGAGFMVLAALGMLFTGVVGASFGRGGSEGLPLAATIGASLLYVVLAAVYVLPCVHLVRYGSAIGRIKLSGEDAIEEALVRQKSFWRALGIMTLGIMALYVLGIIVAIVAAIGFGISETM